MAITFTFPFSTNLNVPDTGLADVVVHIWRRSDGQKVVDGSAASEIGSSGDYAYTYSAASNSEDYVGYAYSASTTGLKYVRVSSGVVGAIQDILADTDELQGNQGNWVTATGFATEAKQDIIDANVDLILEDTNELQSDDIPGSLSSIDSKIDVIDGIVDDILVDTGTDIPTAISAIPTNPMLDTEDGSSFSSIPDMATATNQAQIIGYIDTEISSIISSLAGLNDISVDDILAGVIENSVTIQHVLSIILAFVSGKTSGAASTSIIFRNNVDDTDRITMTVDSDGDRSNVVIDVTDI